MISHMVYVLTASQTLDEEPQFTDEELEEYERLMNEEREKLGNVLDGHAQPGEINVREFTYRLRLYRSGLHRSSFTVKYRPNSILFVKFENYLSMK